MIKNSKIVDFTKSFFAEIGDIALFAGRFLEKYLRRHMNLRN